MTQTMIEKMAMAVASAQWRGAEDDRAQAYDMTNNAGRFLHDEAARASLTVLLEPDAAMVAQLMPNDIPKERLPFETTLAYWRFRTAIMVALGLPLTEGRDHDPRR